MLPLIFNKKDITLALSDQLAAKHLSYYNWMLFQIESIEPICSKFFYFNDCSIEEKLKPLAVADLEIVSILLFGIQVDWLGCWVIWIAKNAVQISNFSWFW